MNHFSSCSEGGAKLRRVKVRHEIDTKDTHTRTHTHMHTHMHPHTHAHTLTLTHLSVPQSWIVMIMGLKSLGNLSIWKIGSFKSGFLIYSFLCRASSVFGNFWCFWIFSIFAPSQFGQLDTIF